MSPTVVDRARDSARDLISHTIRNSPFLWKVMIWAYNRRKKYRSVHAFHPFDEAYGIDTKGAVPGWLLRDGSDADKFIIAYVGCQPSCLRNALAALPAGASRSFVDLGCGLGRAVVLATEFEFSSITGVELSAGLCEKAEANIELFARKFPDRVRPHIVNEDARTFAYPAGSLVVFIYHSFAAPILEKVLDSLEGRESRDLFLIYENPVHGHVVDCLPWLVRWYAANVEATPEERPSHVGSRGVGAESVVVWYSGSQHKPTQPGRDAAIVVDEPEWRCHVQG